MDIETKAESIINGFRLKLKSIADDAISEAYSEILPHAENDTFMNVRYRSQRVIENIISGRFLRGDANTVTTKDDNNIDVVIKITDSQWDVMRKSLITAMPACPKDLEIESLREQLAFEVKRNDERSF